MKFSPKYFERIRPYFPAGDPYMISRKYLLFENDDAVSHSIINKWIYQPYIFPFLNNLNLAGCDIVDVGANNGLFTIDFADYVGPNGRVISFEPQRIIFQQLCGNVFANGLRNVYCHNAAIGHESGQVRIEVPNYFQRNGLVNYGDVHITDNEENSEVVNMWRLDDLEFNNLRLIKIDTQGFEPNVISGAVETIKKHRPFIIVEIEEGQLNKFGFDGESLKAQIVDLGYEVKRFDEGASYNTEDGKCQDFYCIPL
jgi:FkbM family methyltransferase